MPESNFHISSVKKNIGKTENMINMNFYSEAIFKLMTSLSKTKKKRKKKKITTQVGPSQDGETSRGLKMTGYLSHCHRTDCGWTSRETARQKRTWGPGGSAGWGPAPQEGHQQGKGSGSCPTFSTHDVPCETLCPVLGVPSNSKYSEKLERLWWAEGWSVGCCEEWLGALHLFSLEKRRLRRWLLSPTTQEGLSRRWE